MSFSRELCMALIFFPEFTGSPIRQQATPHPLEPQSSSMWGFSWGGAQPFWILTTACGVSRPPFCCQNSRDFRWRGEQISGWGWRTQEAYTAGRWKPSGKFTLQLLASLRTGALSCCHIDTHTCTLTHTCVHGHMHNSTLTLRHTHWQTDKHPR